MRAPAATPVPAPGSSPDATPADAASAVKASAALPPHQSDSHGAQQRLATYCRVHGLRLTPLRQRVLACIEAAGGAIKAYDLMRALSDQNVSVKPPSVYRSLAFLVEHGFVHRIESINAYTACHAPGHGDHAVLLLRCTVCGSVTELDATPADHALHRAATAAGFETDQIILEGLGRCRRCGGTTASRRNATPR